MPHYRDRSPMLVLAATTVIVFLLVLGVAIPMFLWTFCRIEVPSKHIAVLMHKTGKDLPNGEEISPQEKIAEARTADSKQGESVSPAEYKGLQQAVLGEGRYFFNPYEWEWLVVPQIEIPEGKLGVRTRLYGADLPPDELIAWKSDQKGIVPEVLRAGRYQLNAWVVGESRRDQDNYAEYVEICDPVTVPGGYHGVVTLLAGPKPKNPNAIVVEPGERGVQPQVLQPGTYYINPYVQRIDLVDTRSQKFALSEAEVMGFPTKDGFWVTLDGVIEFRVDPEHAAETYVIYNDMGDDEDLGQEIISKVILPNARSFCRLRGSNQSGRDFISGETRAQFQKEFEQAISDTCESQGVEIVQALISKINPPEQIADPVRDREIALETELQYQRQIIQQESEKELAVEKEMVTRNQELVAIQQEVVKVVTQANREKEVALIEAEQRLKVAEFELKAAQDKAAAVLALGKASADVVRFQNQAEAAGWKNAVEALGGDGFEFARWTFLKKLSPSFRSLMVNTADSPMMDIFANYSKLPLGTAGQPQTAAKTPATPVAEEQASELPPPPSESVATAPEENP